MSATVQQDVDHAALLGTVAEDAIRRLEEVRLPLHILLANRFGVLNENQEELLGAARAAADAMMEDLVALRELSALERGELTSRRDRVKPGELLASLRPMLEATAASRHATLAVDLPPLLPAFDADRARLSSALATLFGAVVDTVPEGGEARLVATRAPSAIRIEATGGAACTGGVRIVAAARVVEVHGGSVEWRDKGLVVTLPVI